jgi:xylulokinase
MATGGALDAAMPAIIETIEPDHDLRQAYLPRLEAYRSLYRALRPEFRRSKAG